MCSGYYRGEGVPAPGQQARPGAVADAKTSTPGQFSREELKVSGFRESWLDVGA